MPNQNPKNDKQVVLVVIAHRDDEVLGIGGTIANHIMAGDLVFGISMTDGVGARGNDDHERIHARVQASNKAAKILGLRWMGAANFPDNSMDTIPLLEVVRVIEDAKSRIRPTLIYTHSSADLNIDHRIVSQATLTCFRPQPNEIWQEIRAFEVPSSTDFGHKSITNEFLPNLYVNIVDTWEKKMAALKEYEIEMRVAPHARSLEGLENLAKYRGNQAGLRYAEAFEIVRKIQR